jgi:hypothetical protein
MSFFKEIICLKKQSKSIKIMYNLNIVFMLMILLYLFFVSPKNLVLIVGMAVFESFYLIISTAVLVFEKK